MKTQQICQLLIQTPNKLDTQKDQNIQQEYDKILPYSESQNIRIKLQQILNSLKQQQEQFQLTHVQQQKLLIQKINIQKDQIIQELLKNIYNLKRQNQQLNFQFRRRFKVIQNLQFKYQNLIQLKNKKINQQESIIKYLQTKLKQKQLKLFKLQKKINKKHSQQKYQQLSHHQSKEQLIKNNKISLIVSKPKKENIHLQKCSSLNSLEDLTIPMKYSFISLSKVTSSSKTIAKNNHNSEIQTNDPRESIAFSSFLGSTQQFLNSKNSQVQSQFQELSRIRPICLEKNASSSRDYINLQDFQDVQNFKIFQPDRSMRRSQQVKVSQPFTYRNSANQR